MAVQGKEEEKDEVEHRHRGLKRYGFFFFMCGPHQNLVSLVCFQTVTPVSQMI